MDPDDRTYRPLGDGVELDDNLRTRIVAAVRTGGAPRHVEALANPVALWAIRDAVDVAPNPNQERDLT